MSWSARIIANERKSMNNALASIIDNLDIESNENSPPSNDSIGTRKRSSSNDDSNRMSFDSKSKRQRKEINHQLREMEYNLDQALSCAHDGNREDMKSHLEEAKYYAKQSNAVSVYSKRAKEIRFQLGDEMAFHLREMEDDLKLAMKFAKKGDRELMEIKLEDAKKHAKSSRSLREFEWRSTRIKWELGDEDAFHMEEMEDNFESAMRYAKEGDKELMNQHLHEAREHSNGVVSSHEFEVRAKEIKNQIGSCHDFHMRKMEGHLSSALRFAKNGGKEMMEYHLSEAEGHAASFSYHGMANRVSEVVSVFYG